MEGNERKEGKRKGRAGRRKGRGGDLHPVPQNSTQIYAYVYRVCQ